MSEKNVDRKTQYVTQCWAARHKTQTLAMDYALSMPNNGDGVPALMLHDNFSRFVMTLIDNSTNTRQILKANILAKEVPYLLERYELASKTLFDAQNQSKAEAEAKEAAAPSPAYTVQIRAGSMKGKTPAEILLADATKERELTSHKQWLAENLKQWPTNQKIIDAIDDALYLLSANALREDVEAPKTSIYIFKEDFKVMSGGPSGNSKLAVKISIACELDRENPWHFYFENTEHPVANGSVDKETVLSRRSANIFLNGKEMAEFVDCIRKIKTNFERISFDKAYDFVTNYNWRDYAASAATAN